MGVADQRPDERNVFTVEHQVTTAARERRNGHRGAILWLTGLSGAGKSTLAIGLETELHKRGRQVYVLDGDNMRGGLNSDLGFSAPDRTENIRRVGEVAALFADAGLIVISAFISPYRQDRRCVRAIRPGIFHEVFVKADLATCERRDPKGLYARARTGEIADFTGVSAPYEEPEQADVIIDTASLSIDDSLALLTGYVERQIIL